MGPRASSAPAGIARPRPLADARQLLADEHVDDTLRADDGAHRNHRRVVRDDAAYLDRLMKRPSFARCVREAEPYLNMFPKG